jgi:diguanylate cyclase (GGDEF)-like protein
VTEPDAAGAGFEAVPDAAVVLDADAVIVATNLAWRMFSIDNGGDPDLTGIGVNYLDVCARSVAGGDEDARHVAAGLRDVLDGWRVEAGLEYRCPAPGRRRWFVVRIRKLSESRAGVVVVHHNITQQKIAEEAMGSLADMIDPLTGLAARAVFETQLATAVGRAGNRGGSPNVGVIQLRVDGYGPITARLGQIAADEALQTLAHRLRDVVGPSNTLARLGRATFAVLATGIGHGVFTDLADRVQRAAATPHLIHGTETDVPVKIGSHLGRVGDEPTAILGRADVITRPAA